MMSDIIRHFPIIPEYAWSQVRVLIPGFDLTGYDQHVCRVRSLLRRRYGYRRKIAIFSSQNRLEGVLRSLRQATRDEPHLQDQSSTCLRPLA